MSRIETYLRSKAICLILESFSFSEAASTFGVDYRNMCAYMRGRKIMPLSLVFSILDYFDARVVVFRSQTTL